MTQQIKYYSVKQLAKRYNVSLTTIYDWIKQGLKAETIRYIGQRRRQRIAQPDLEDFFKAQNFIQTQPKQTDPKQTDPKQESESESE